jgi:hypothetical protein
MSILVAVSPGENGCPSLSEADGPMQRDGGTPHGYPAESPRQNWFAGLDLQ